MDHLPNELVDEIIQYVSLWVYRNLAPTCSLMNSKLHEDKLWKQFCKSYDIEPKELDYIGSIKRALYGEWINPVIPSDSRKRVIKYGPNKQLRTYKYKWYFNKLNTTFRIKIHSRKTLLAINLDGKSYYHTLVLINNESIRTQVNFQQLQKMDEICIKQLGNKSIQIFCNNKVINEYDETYFSSPSKSEILFDLSRGCVEFL